MELAVDVVRPLPAGMAGRVRAEHVVVHLQVLEAQLLDGSRVGSHAARVRPDLRLRKDDPDLHWRRLLNQALVGRGYQRGQRRLWQHLRQGVLLGRE